MFTIFIILFSVFIIHIICGFICFLKIVDSDKTLLFKDLCFISLFAPLILIIWVIGDAYCWILSLIYRKKNERRRIEK